MPKVIITKNKISGLATGAITQDQDGVNLDLYNQLAVVVQDLSAYAYTISGGTVDVSNGDFNITNGDLNITNGRINLINSDISSSDPLNISVSNTTFIFRENMLDMDSNKINNTQLIDGSINGISGEIVIQANNKPIDLSNNSTVTINSLLQLPISTMNDISNSFSNFNSEDKGIYAYDSNLNILAYKANSTDIQNNASDVGTSFSDNIYTDAWKTTRRRGGTNLARGLIYNISPNVITFHDYFNDCYFTTTTTSGKITTPFQLFESGNGGMRNTDGHLITPYFDPSVNVRWINGGVYTSDISENGILSPGYTTKTDILITGAEFFVEDLYNGGTLDASLSYTNSFASIKRSKPLNPPEPSYRPPSALSIGIYTSPSLDISGTSINRFIIGPILCGPETYDYSANVFTVTESNQKIFYTNKYPLFIPKNTYISPFLYYTENSKATVTPPPPGGNSSIEDTLYLFGKKKHTVPNPNFICSNGNVNYDVDISSCYSGFKLHIHEYYERTSTMNTYSAVLGGMDDICLW